MVPVKKSFLGKPGERWFDYADVIAALAEFGGMRGHVKLSGSSLGSLTGISQQAASRRLIKALEVGLIERITTPGGFEYALSKAAQRQLLQFMKIVRTPPANKQIRAMIVAGVGEGKFFLQLRGYRKQFEQIYGFKPFPGTLNLRTNTNVFDIFRTYPAKIVNGFSTGNREFGLVLTYTAELRYGTQTCRCVALFPEYSRYGEEVVEAIAPFSIKKRLKISDGAEVLIKPLMNDSEVTAKF